MTQDQIILFSLYGGVLVALLWGRLRYDVVAFAALLVGVAAGVVPAGQAFAGFGHPATVIVALVLIVSGGLTRSGAISLLTRRIADRERRVGGHIAVMGALGAVMSGFMNNIAALALLMPSDMQTARAAGRPAGMTLMPLAFATILGGMVTLIGTPPNIIVATIRAEEVGESFAMFDFLPVGGAVALAGLAFVALVGWRLIPRRPGIEESEADVAEFIAELVVREGSRLAERRVREIEKEAEAADLAILAVMRDGKRRYGAARNLVLAAGDVLMVEASPEGIESFRSAMELDFADRPGGAEISDAQRSGVDMASGAGMVLVEAVVLPRARIAGRTAQAIGLSWRQQTVLMGISREGRTIRDRVRRTVIAPGDILLLLVPEETREDVTDWLGVLPLSKRDVSAGQARDMALAAGLFVLAIALVSFGFVTMPVALGFVVVGYLIARIVPLPELYGLVDWPVIVLLGSLIPLGVALDRTGGTGLIAGWLLSLTGDLPPWVALAALMVATMTLSDVLNNNATTILAAGVGLRMAEQLGANPDPFLIAVAVGASCAFLTPIGHQNNTVILGPGGYHFGDYWRMGLPLEIIVVAVGLPMILLVWPM